MTEDPIKDDVLDKLMNGGTDEGPDLVQDLEKKRPRVAAASNPLLMRLRLAALLVIGHKNYPDALSRLTNIQAGMFSLFDAVRMKGEAWMERPALPRHPTGSRYYALKELYRQAAQRGVDETPERLPNGEGRISLSAPAPRPGQGGAGGLPKEYSDPCMYFGIRVFADRYKAMSQSILAEGRQEYLEAIQEKPAQVGHMRPEDLNVPKPSLVEEVTGRRPGRRREQ